MSEFVKVRTRRGIDRFECQKHYYEYLIPSTISKIFGEKWKPVRNYHMRPNGDIEPFHTSASKGKEPMTESVAKCISDFFSDFYRK